MTEAEMQALMAMASNPAIVARVDREAAAQAGAEAAAQAVARLNAEAAAPPPAAAPATPPPAAPPISLSPQDQALIATAMQIRAAQPQAGFSLVQRPGLSPGMNQLLDALQGQAAAPAAAPQPQADAATTPAPVLDRQFQVLAAMREWRQEQAARPVSQPLAQGFLRTPTLFELAGGK